MMGGQSHLRPAIQLWLPFNSFSMYDEEFSYALGKAALEWREEDRIWFLPYIKEICCWSNPRLPIVTEMALPSTSFNVITSMHINQEKQIFPANTVGIPKDWTQVPDDLFVSFVNSTIESALLLEQTKFQVIAPHFSEDGRGRNAIFSASVGPGLECSVDEVNKLLMSEPFAESLGRQKDAYEPDAFDYENSDTSNVVFRFDTPVLNEMFGLGINPYVLNAQVLMKKYITERNVAKIRTTAAKYISPASGSFYQAWVLPKLMYHNTHNPERASEIVLTELEAELKLNKDYQTLSEALRDDDNTYVLFEKEYPILRIFTWIGYFWWELLRKVEETADFPKTCGNCGRIITGTKAKKYCDKDENRECWNLHRALGKRKERKRKAERDGRLYDGTEEPEKR